MQFPLDMLTSRFAYAGYTVEKTPKHPKNTFTWVSSYYDAEAPAENVGHGKNALVYVTDTRKHLPEEAVCVVVRAPGDEPFSVDDFTEPNDICIVSELSPTVIADRLQRYLMSIIQWNDDMGALLDNNCICQDLLKASEPMLECYIGLSDSTYSYIAHTPNIKPADSASRYFIENRFYSPESLRKAREMGLMKVWEHQDWTAVSNTPNELCDKPSLNRVFHLNGTYAAHLVLVSPTEISAAQVFLFNLLAKRVELCLGRHWRTENPLNQRYTYFLKELLSGNVYDSASLEERARLHGLPTGGLFEMCIVDNTWRVGSANYFAKKLLEVEPNCKVAFEESRVVVLLCLPEPKRGRLKDMESHLFELVHRMHLEAGVSDRYENIDQSALALDKARIALKYGHLKSRRFAPFDDDPTAEEVFRFRRYFPYFVTDPFSRSDQFVTKLLASPNPLSALRESDKEHGTNDYEILRTYLYGEGSIKTICEVMHMHRNTVNYRLEKIRAVVAADLADPDTRMYLRMLYYLAD